MQKLSIIIPVYNEEKTLSEVIAKVLSVRLGRVRKEIVIVDDASTDKTHSILAAIAQPTIKIAYHHKNKGKGAAIRTGLAKSTGDIIIIQDADLEYSPDDYAKILEPILQNKCAVVYGSRIDAIKRDFKNMYYLHYFGNRFLAFCTNLLYGSRLTDMETCYKAFRREVLAGVKLSARRFEIEPEITAKILKRGYTIYEVPISFKGRKFHEGKKITWKDGLWALYYLLKYKIKN